MRSSPILGGYTINMFEFDFPTGTAVLDYMFVDQDPRLGYGGAVARARRCSRETGDFTDLAVMLDKAKAQRIAAWAAVRASARLMGGPLGPASP